MASGHPASIGDELKTFLESPVSVLVGTRDSRLVPEITRACLGCRNSKASS
jgi:hypothetical protein